MSESVVRVKNLTKSFSGRRVVDRLSFEVQPGEVFALLGHNGAGKSTTIDLILGLKKPEEGYAHILGMNAAQNRRKVFERVGVQLQNTQYRDSGILVEICESIVAAKRETGDLRFRILPRIQAACVFHRGSYRTLSESYETVLRFIEENDYEIAGEIRESYIDGVWNRDDESQWLSEIQVPVRKRHSCCE